MKKFSGIFLIMCVSILLTACGQDKKNAELVSLIAQGKNAEAIEKAEQLDNLNISCPVKYVVEDCSNIDNTDLGERISPLAMACATGNADMIEYLLNSGADAMDPYDGDKTIYPLEYFCSYGCACGGESLQLLLDSGAKPNSFGKEAPAFRLASGLSVATTDYTDRCEEIIMLVEEGADWIGNSKEYEGDSLLHMAAIQTVDTPLEELLETEQASEYLNCTDAAGNTPLMSAVKAEAWKNVIVLLAHGADETITNEDGMTAQQIAQTIGNKTLIETFNLLSEN